MPLIMPNFIALGQTMYEKKCYKFLYTVEYSVAPGDPVRPSSINMGGDVQQGPLYKAAKFRPLLKTPL